LTAATEIKIKPLNCWASAFARCVTAWISWELKSDGRKRLPVCPLALSFKNEVGRLMVTLHPAATQSTGTIYRILRFFLPPFGFIVFNLFNSNCVHRLMGMTNFVTGPTIMGRSANFDERSSSKYLADWFIFYIISGRYNFINVLF
jgi:hypothetical protein